MFFLVRSGHPNRMILTIILTDRIQKQTMKVISPHRRNDECSHANIKCFEMKPCKMFHACSIMPIPQEYMQIHNTAFHMAYCNIPWKPIIASQANIYKRSMPKGCLSESFHHPLSDTPSI
ncbi:hypothetical protein [Methanococcoides vulcani]|uniref:hypothetical protein n=1 Tax=Methanococcoides vulcani TaxID=1353158 RepID=UPI001C42EA2C|nr:hypothetical protein [Methanococcoides vulcani]